MLGFLKKVTTSVLGESAPTAEFQPHASPRQRPAEDESGSVMHRGRFLRDMPVSQLRRLLMEDFGERAPSDARRNELVRLLAEAVLRSQHGPLAAASPVATHRPPAQLPVEVGFQPLYAMSSFCELCSSLCFPTGTATSWASRPTQPFSEARSSFPGTRSPSLLSSIFSNKTCVDFCIFLMRPKSSVLDFSRPAKRLVQEGGLGVVSGLSAQPATSVSDQRAEERFPTPVARYESFPQLGLNKGANAFYLTLV